MIDRAAYLALVERVPKEIPKELESSVRLLSREIVQVRLTADRGTGAERSFLFHVTMEALAAAKFDLFGHQLAKAAQALVETPPYRLVELDRP